MKKRYRTILLVALGALFLDRLTKLWVMQSFVYGESRPVIDGFFNLVRVHNSGAAFGLMSDPESTWQLWLFAASAVAAALIVYFMARSEDTESPLFFTSLGLILGGAAGNLFDRMRYRHVVDFLDFYWQDWHWPAFNVADIAICLGVAGVALYLFMRRKTSPDRRQGHEHTRSRN